MADTIGGVTLVEFVEVSADGTFCTLYGWPRALTPSTFGSNYEAALRSVGWRPYKLVDSCSPANPQSLSSRLIGILQRVWLVFLIPADC